MPKGHQVLKKNSKETNHMQEKHNNENETIFGDKLLPEVTQTWAQKTGVLCPVIEEKKTSEENKIKEDTNGWKTVGKKGSAKGIETEPHIFKVPTSNRFTNLPDQADTNSASPELKKSKSYNCNVCGMSFSTSFIIEEHKRKSHPSIKIKYNTDTENSFEPNQEKKLHNETKKELQALKIEYKSCKEELTNVQEEKDRLKIKVNDLKSILELKGKSKIQTSKDTHIDSIPEKMFKCDECNYPFMTINEKNTHVEKHKHKKMQQDINQACSLCTIEFNSDIAFMKHIQNKHSSEFNCQECDFQAGSSSIILAKHMNLRHRKAEEQTDDTLKCNRCEQRFSAKWNLNNHIRDSHDRMEYC